MAPATAAAASSWAGIDQIRGNVDLEKFPTARSTNARRKRQRKAEAQFGGRNPTWIASAEPIRAPRPDFGCRRSPQGQIGRPGVTKWLGDFSGLESAACGSPPRRAYPR
jgi:hypothetical protein